MDLGHWHTTTIIWVAASGIVSGNGDGWLNSSGLTTYAQVAQMLMNYSEK